MKRLAYQIGHYSFLVALTVVATLVMWWVSSKNSTGRIAEQADVQPAPAVAEIKTPVAVVEMRPELCDLTMRYSGKIQAWETYSLGFEIAGRVESLGENANGKPLDEGDRVEAGQVLARLDDRVLRARRAEVVAQMEQASSDMNRAKRLYEQGGQLITDEEYQSFLTTLALRKAQQESADKNLEDTTLTSPVTGAISKRMVEAGESVTASETVFEIVENKDVLLVVDVPESRVRELQLRMQAVEQAQASGGSGDPESLVFRARVELEGRDLFGNRWPTIDAEVYRIAQVADSRTGLFPVEIRIPNSDGLLRPGMVASADIVTDRLLAYEIPETACIFRDGETYVFTIENEPADMQVMFWDVGDTEVASAKRVELSQWIDQGHLVLVPAESLQLNGAVVTKGQQRLTTGQRVRIVRRNGEKSTTIAGQ